MVFHETSIASWLYEAHIQRPTFRTSPRFIDVSSKLVTTSQLAPEILTSFLIHVPLCNTASIDTLTIPIPRQILTSRRHVGTTSWTLLPQGEETTCQPSCARTTIVSFTDISIPCDNCIVLTTLYSLLLDLPLEIQCMILRHLDDIHYLTLLLTCKDMKPIVNFAIKKPCTKQDCALGLSNVVAAMS